jgi:hypothetical protein
MAKRPQKPEWHLIDGVARVWDGESWLEFEWSEPKGWYEIQGVDHYWDGKNWYQQEEEDVDEEEDEDEVSNWVSPVGVRSNKRHPVFQFFIKVSVFLVVIFSSFFLWNLFTSAPSTTSICYIFSKATDASIPEEESINAAQWWEDNIKTQEDLENVDPQVLSALRLYEETNFLDEALPEGMGLRDFVISTCEEVAPGSTDH